MYDAVRDAAELLLSAVETLFKEQKYDRVEYDSPKNWLIDTASRYGIPGAKQNVRRILEDIRNAADELKSALIRENQD